MEHGSFFIRPGAGCWATVPDGKRIVRVIPVDNVNQGRRAIGQLGGQQHIQCPAGVTFAGSGDSSLVQDADHRARPDIV